MARLPAEDLWRRHILEGYYAFKLSTDWRSLRKEGMRVLGRRALFTPEEWMASFHERATSKEYRAWLDSVQSRDGVLVSLQKWSYGRAC